MVADIGVPRINQVVYGRKFHCNQVATVLLYSFPGSMARNGCIVSFLLFGIFQESKLFSPSAQLASKVLCVLSQTPSVRTLSLSLMCFETGDMQTTNMYQIVCNTVSAFHHVSVSQNILV